MTALESLYIVAIFAMLAPGIANLIERNMRVPASMFAAGLLSYGDRVG